MASKIKETIVPANLRVGRVIHRRFRIFCKKRGAYIGYAAEEALEEYMTARKETA